MNNIKELAERLRNEAADTIEQQEAEIERVTEMFDMNNDALGRCREGNTFLRRERDRDHADIKQLRSAIKTYASEMRRQGDTFPFYTKDHNLLAALDTSPISNTQENDDE